jgi:hypothetical protein
VDNLDAEALRDNRRLTQSCGREILASGGVIARVLSASDSLTQTCDSSNYRGAQGF